MTNFTVIEGTTQRLLIDALNPNGGRYNATGKTIKFLMKAKSADAVQAVGGTPPHFELVVDGTGVATSTPANRMFLGRPDPTNLGGPLIDTAATSGYITIRLAPSDTVDLVTTTTKTFEYECKDTTVTVDPDGYRLGRGQITVEDSLFDN